MQDPSPRIRPFGEVVDILDSRRVPVNSEERAKRAGDVPYYGATEQVGCIDTHVFDEELVLLGEDGAPFLNLGKPKAYLIRGKSWVNNHAHVLRAKPGLLNSFLLYQLNNLDYRPYVSGTTRLKLPQGPMKRIPLLVPLEEEQRQIVAEIEKQFTRIEAGVAALRRMQANLKRYRAAVLKAACEGKLVPTEAELQKLAGKGQKGFESGEELLKRILAERRQHWSGRGQYKEPAVPEITNLPPLPVGWTWATLGSLIREPLRNGHSAKATGTQTGLRVFTLSAVTEGDFSVRNTKLSVATPEKVAGLWAEPGDIYVERSNTPELVGIARLYKGAARFAFIPDLFIRVRVASDVSERYIEACLLSERGRIFFRSRAQGISGTMPKIDQETVELAPIPLPPLAEQTRVVAEVERRLSVVDELEAMVSANLQRATRVRQSILQQAFTDGLYD